MSRYNARALQLNNNGNSVQVWDVNPNDPNQLWYLDDNNVLRSSVNDYCIHSDGKFTYFSDKYWKLRLNEMDRSLSGNYQNDSLYNSKQGIMDVE